MGLPAKPDFLGRGWSFPPTFMKELGSVATVADVADIDQSLTVLLGTTPGERVMVPTYGCDLWKYVFRDLTTSLLSEIRDDVGTAIIRWEPRIDMLSLTVDADPPPQNRISIIVDYVIRTTNVRSNLVYPFYLLEATLADGR